MYDLIYFSEFLLLNVFISLRNEIDNYIEAK